MSLMIEDSAGWLKMIVTPSKPRCARAYYNHTSYISSLTIGFSLHACAFSYIHLTASSSDVPRLYEAAISCVSWLTLSLFRGAVILAHKEVGRSEGETVRPHDV